MPGTLAWQTRSHLLRDRPFQVYNRGTPMREKHFLPRRRSVRLAHFDYSQCARYFLTICSQDRRPAFSRVTGATVELSALGQIVLECWIEIPKHFSQVELGPQVVMPDHVHGILTIRTPVKLTPAKVDGSDRSANGDIPAKDERRARYIVPLREEGVREFGAPVAGSIATIIATFKAAISRKCTRQIGRAQPTLWQRGYYEHVIRDEQDFSNACAYIRSNPARRTFEREDWG